MYEILNTPLYSSTKGKFTLLLTLISLPFKFSLGAIDPMLFVMAVKIFLAIRTALCNSSSLGSMLSIISVSESVFTTLSVQEFTSVVFESSLELLSLLFFVLFFIIYWSIKKN